MRAIVNFAISHARLTLAVMIFLILAGIVAYQNIPKEASPEVKVPIIYVSLAQRGISPEDAERLLVRPMETELKTVPNIKEMRAAAFEGGGFVLIEFEAGFNADVAMQDVRAKVDGARSSLPADADEPTVNEVDLSLFPVVVVTLAGDLSERALTAIARQAKTAIEEVPGVLAADVRGTRDEVVEILAEPMLLQSYGVAVDQFAAAAAGGNSLVAAGALEGPNGRFPVKVPALIETPEDVLNIPVAASNNATVRLGDVAEIRPTFKDATTVTRVNGKPAITIEVRNRAGSNVIETVDGVRAAIARIQPNWPAALEVNFIQDQSTLIKQLLNDLQNSVFTGVLLVVVIILFILGGRASIFVGIAIPVSFLTGILGLALFGLTLNIVALFSLILAVGMLVDDAIIVAEFAERRMSEGMKPRDAYLLAAQRMAGPVAAATFTRIAAFSPLLFWPGIVGEFMMYLPVTLIATLSASMVTALIFTPTLGALIGKPQPHEPDRERRDTLYMRIIGFSIRRPLAVIGLAVLLLVGVMYSYGRFGAGVEFFPAIEPDTGSVLVHARGNLSLGEKDAMIHEVEQRILDMPELDTIYARAGDMGRGADNITEDVIGQIQFTFIDWQQRRPAGVVMDDIRARTADIPGIRVEVTAAEQGPPTGKPIQIQLASDNPEALDQAARQVAAQLRQRPEIRDLDDGLPLPGIDWRLEIDKAKAAQYGIGVGNVGLAVQLVTNGVKITDYRPPGVDKPVDIILRFPPDRRTLGQIDDLRVQTPAGAVPIGNFIQRVPAQRVGTINRVDGRRVINVTANLTEGVNVAAVQQQVAQQLAAADFGNVVTWKLGGSNEEQEAASAFLANAFGAALFLIFAILLLVFNKFSSVGLILSSIILSTIGVFLGLLIMNQALSVVMTGVGIIALAGVITNNNIVLIDTYDRLRREGVDWKEAILHTAHERARPVLLTAVAAVLGVLPIAFGLNIDFLTRELTYGAPSTQWWIQLSTAIVFGLSFATVLTLIVTPASLAAIARLADWRAARKQRRLERRKPKPPPPEPMEHIDETPRLAAE